MTADAELSDAERCSRALVRVGGQVDRLDLRMTNAETRLDALGAVVAGMTDALRANSSSSERLAASLDRFDVRIDALQAGCTSHLVELERVRAGFPRLLLLWVVSLFAALLTLGGWVATVYLPQLAALFRWVVHFATHGVPPA